MIEFYTLGLADLRTESGESITSVLVQPKRVGVLAYLAVAQPRGFHRRDLVLSLFWPEHDEPHARGALRQALHMLRHELGTETLLTRGEEIGVAPGSLWCDVWAFEDSLVACDLETAVSYYRGPFLDGFHLRDDGEFERWVTAQRAQLFEECGVALEQLGHAARCNGDLKKAAKYWQRLASLDPYNSRVAMELADTLVAAGDRGNAVLHLREHARRLREDLGIEPAAEVLEFPTWGREQHEAWSDTCPTPASHAWQPRNGRQPNTSTVTSTPEDPASFRSMVTRGQSSASANVMYAAS